MPRPAAETASWLRTGGALLDGLLAGGAVGGVVGLALAHRSLAHLAPLQAGSQALFVGATGAGSAAVGALAGVLGAGALALFRREGRVWPGWIALAGLGAIELHVALEPAALPAVVHAFVLLAAGAALLALGALLGRRVRALQARELWAAALLALLGAALARIVATPAMDQGVPPFARLAWGPLALFGILVVALRRRRSTLVVALVALLCFGAEWVVWGRATAPHGAQRSPRTNLLLVTIDTLRADHVSCYGSTRARTPNIDALAADGVQWEDAISPIPETNPAHSSILTGLYPGRHGVIDNAPYAFLPGVETLPELCRRAGYTTAAFVSGYTLKRELSRLFLRFEVYDDVFGFLPWVPSEWRDTSLPIVAKELAPFLGLRLRILDERFDRRADALVDAGLDWLQRNGDGPFFLWLHFYDPHMPYDPPAPYDRMYGDPDGAHYEPNWYDFDPDRREQVLRGGKTLERFRALYSGEVSYVDHELGRLFAGMKADGLWDRTAVVLTADHGESLGEHDYYFDHSYFLYDASLKVPLIARFPDGLGRGMRVPEQVRLVDVLPTVADYLGLGARKGLDGVSLLPRLRGEPPPADPPPAFSVTYEFRITQMRRLLSVRTGRWKYVRTSHQWDEFRRRPGSEELYDLVADPGELHDLAAERTDLLARFREESQEEWESWSFDVGHVDAEISDRDRERLRALGYF